MGAEQMLMRFIGEEVLTPVMLPSMELAGANQETGKASGYGSCELLYPLGTNRDDQTQNTPRSKILRKD